MARKQARGVGTKGKSDSSIDRWNTYNDIPDNNQDAFHRLQDRIALGDMDEQAMEDDDEYGKSLYEAGVVIDV